MNNTTHTPGPTCTCGIITTVIETGIGCYDENEIAQCPLCKAAPAMYEALQDAYEKLCYLAPDKFDGEEHEANWQRDLSTMLAALAQAEGAQHE